MNPEHLIAKEGKFEAGKLTEQTRFIKPVVVFLCKFGQNGGRAAHPLLKLGFKRTRRRRQAQLGNRRLKRHTPGGIGKKTVYRARG